MGASEKESARTRMKHKESIGVDLSSDDNVIDKIVSDIQLVEADRNSRLGAICSHVNCRRCNSSSIAIDELVFGGEAHKQQESEEGRHRMDDTDHGDLTDGWTTVSRKKTKTQLR